jgi:hypothetical protein
MVRICQCVLLLAVGACTTQWRLRGLPQTLEPKTQVEIWSHGTAVHWRAVRVSTDSIRGIPYPQSIKCDMCQRALTRSDIDSFRLRQMSDAERSGWIVACTFALIGAFYLEVVCGEHGGPSCPFGTWR